MFNGVGGYVGPSDPRRTVSVAHVPGAGRGTVAVPYPPAVPVVDPRAQGLGGGRAVPLRAQGHGLSVTPMQQSRLPGPDNVSLSSRGHGGNYGPQGPRSQL